MVWNLSSHSFFILFTAHHQMKSIVDAHIFLSFSSEARFQDFCRHWVHRSGPTNPSYAATTVDRRD